MARGELVAVQRQAAVGDPDGVVGGRHGAVAVAEHLVHRAPGRRVHALTSGVILQERVPGLLVLGGQRAEHGILRHASLGLALIPDPLELRQRILHVLLGERGVGLAERVGEALEGAPAILRPSRASPPRSWPTECDTRPTRSEFSLTLWALASVEATRGSAAPRASVRRKVMRMRMTECSSAGRPGGVLCGRA